MFTAACGLPATAERALKTLDTRRAVESDTGVCSLAHGRRRVGEGLDCFDVTLALTSQMACQSRAEGVSSKWHAVRPR